MPQLITGRWAREQARYVRVRCQGPNLIKNLDRAEGRWEICPRAGEMLICRLKLQRSSSRGCIASWQIMTTTMLTGRARGNYCKKLARFSCSPSRSWSLRSSSWLNALGCDKLHVVLECCASLLLRQVVLTRPQRMQSIKRSPQCWTFLRPVVLLKWNHHHHQVTEAESLSCRWR